MAESSVVDRVAKACDDLGQVELAGIKLESADIRLLDLLDMTLDEHVAMQASAIAYYGSLVKEASRRLAAFKRHYDRWEKKQYALAKAVVVSGTKAVSSIKVEDVKAQFIIDNEPEIEKKEKQLEQLELESDTLSVWYEAWKQKGFAIREMVGITEDERWNSPTSARKESAGDSPQGSARFDRVREIIRGGNRK